MTTATEQVKTGTTGSKPTITRILWTGTAEITCFGQHRVPAALVDTGCMVASSSVIIGGTLGCFRAASGRRWMAI